jgi:hypothetical protein
MDNQQQQQQQQQTTSSRFGLRNTGGEIVEVQGGHIVRSIGRKDRHSKVCTAKGPRDRRVRLSAHTAIQFYDVQDRLGYDRPSKAVDWLIKKAKAAIDELDELPAWKPTAGTTSNPNFEASNMEEENQNSSSFLPPSMDSDSIADTIKSFFPESNNSSGMQFQSYPQTELLSRTSSQSQDLKLSLQSFQDPMLLHHHQQQHQNPTNPSDQTIFSGNPMGFDGSGWSENQAAEIIRFQRMFSWNNAGDSGGGGECFPAPSQQPLFGQTQFFSSQRGPLQSSNTSSVRAWIDPDHHHQLHHQTLPFHQSQVSGIGFTSGDGFSGFRIPARIQGEHEEHDGISDKPSSASSESRH